MEKHFNCYLSTSFVPKQRESLSPKFPDSELRIYLRDVVRKSEYIFALISENDLISPLLIETLLNIIFKHFVNVDMILQRICVAAYRLKQSLNPLPRIIKAHIKKDSCCQRKELNST